MEEQKKGSEKQRTWSEYFAQKAKELGQAVALATTLGAASMGVLQGEQAQAQTMPTEAPKTIVVGGSLPPTQFYAAANQNKTIDAYITVMNNHAKWLKYLGAEVNQAKEEIAKNAKGIANLTDDQKRFFEKFDEIVIENNESMRGYYSALEELSDLQNERARIQGGRDDDQDEKIDGNTGRLDGHDKELNELNKEIEALKAKVIELESKIASGINARDWAKMKEKMDKLFTSDLINSRNIELILSQLSEIRGDYFRVLEQLETEKNRNDEQDRRLDLGDVKDKQQDKRLDAGEAKDKQQDRRLDQAEIDRGRIKNKNDEQDKTDNMLLYGIVGTGGIIVVGGGLTVNEARKRRLAEELAAEQAARDAKKRDLGREGGI